MCSFLYLGGYRSIGWLCGASGLGIALRFIGASHLIGVSDLSARDWENAALRVLAG
ncbi:hypothetical protein [Arcanobacterium pinnipediorum]|uniref:Uncharacterized protein n=1 Tax=Arcanobacterium pinnipediorum TaxID=1503041 RepID=A0ABY5AG27_9ACTO|nr:hypothetical protein [Arcanobacterium pinnipediorum]USR78822.1 hypothetical protein NG665_05355 [Arcanobacterium pinnipediorum]